MNKGFHQINSSEESGPIICLCKDCEHFGAPAVDGAQKSSECVFTSHARWLPFPKKALATKS